MTYRLSHSALRRGGRTVLAAAEHAIPPGARVAVIGANGAGKSTLFLALAGVLRRRGGSARIHGPESGLRFTFMPQQPALPGWLDVGAAIDLAGGGAAKRAEVTRALRLDELLPRRVASLSGGEVQAVALAAALMRGGDVLILDEPFAHLDFRRRLAAIELVRGEPVLPRLTLVSSQSAADLITFCDWYLVLAHGRAVFCGSLDELLSPSDPARDRLPLVESRLLALTD